MCWHHKLQVSCSSAGIRDPARHAHTLYCCSRDSGCCALLPGSAILGAAASLLRGRCHVVLHPLLLCRLFPGLHAVLLLLVVVKQHLLPVAGVLHGPKVSLVGLRLAVHQGRRLGQGDVLLAGCRLQRSRCGGGGRVGQARRHRALQGSGCSPSRKGLRGGWQEGGLCAQQQQRRQAGRAGRLASRAMLAAVGCTWAEAQPAAQWWGQASP